MARILVADDEPALAELFGAVLEADGHTVGAVDSGSAALARLAEVSYDLVICDLNMPEVDGVAIYRAVQQLAPPRPSVLLMTGQSDPPACADFLETSAVGVLSKPIGIDELRERVRALLEVP